MLIYYQNVNGVRSKTTEIYLNILNNCYDIICLTETNLNTGVHDTELIDSRYNVYRRDRCDTIVKKQDGGGILVAIKKDIGVVRQTSWDSNVEDIWLSILLNDRKLEN